MAESILAERCGTKPSERNTASIDFVALLLYSFMLKYLLSWIFLAIFTNELLGSKAFA